MKHIYLLYKKPNINSLYNHRKSDQPIYIIKHVPSSVEESISVNTVNEEIFYKHCNFYNEALKKSGDKCPDIKYNKDNTNNHEKNSNKKYIWYTMP